jgi:glycosyltransferase involved in cell wall biosynthesis
MKEMTNTPQTHPHLTAIELEWPRISIVVPNYNQGDYLEDTLRSILDQGYPRLELLVVDGGSTDQSVEVIQRYEAHLAWWVSEPDRGMYEAVQKGFARSTGEIMGWIGSDDMYHRYALFTVGEIFERHTQIRWLTGCPTHHDEYGRSFFGGGMRSWSKFNYYRGDFKFIQQESTFWRRALWEEAGAHVDADLKNAGDLELWTRFFRHAKLYVTAAPIAGYRYRRSNQLTLDHLDRYLREAHEALRRERALLSSEDRRTLRRILRIDALVRLVSRLRLIDPARLRRWCGYDALFAYPPPVLFDRKTQRFEIGGKVRPRHSHGRRAPVIPDEISVSQ